MAEKLGWDKIGKRWRKFHQGKWYYLSDRNVNKTDKAVHEAARERWYQIRGTKPQTIAQRHLQRMAEWNVDQGNIDQAKILEVEADNPQALDPLRMMSPEGAAVWRDRLSTQKPSKGKNLGEAITQYLELQKLRIKTGKLSLGSWGNLEQRLKWMMQKLSKSMPVETIDESTIVTLYTAAVGAEMSAADQYLKTCKRFIKWAWSVALLEKLPRNIDNRDYAVSATVKEVEVMPVEVWRSLYAAATDRTKLYMLLAANCGFTQADIADLQNSEYDRKVGIITRKRTKRKNDPKAPVIEYKLWPETKKLVDHFAQSEGLLILNEDGKPLLNRKAGTKVDNIYVTFFRLQRKNEKKWAFSVIRATSASLIHNSETYAESYRLILGRAPQGVDEKHYLKQAFVKFHRAQEWLRTQYLEEKSKRTAKKRLLTAK